VSDPPASPTSQAELLLSEAGQVELLGPPTRRTYGGRQNWGRRRSQTRYGRLLRGQRADEAARIYLDGALGDHEWHELEGLWVLAWAQGIPRTAFDRVLATYQLERARRGYPDAEYARLEQRITERDLGTERAILAEVEVLIAAGDARWLDDADLAARRLDEEP
jgi:hypothetical protein